MSTIQLSATSITVLLPFFEGSYSDDHDTHAYPGHLDDAAIVELLNTGKLWKPSDDLETFDLSHNAHEEDEWKDGDSEFAVGDGVVAYKCTQLSYVIVHTYLAA